MKQNSGSLQRLIKSINFSLTDKNRGWGEKDQIINTRNGKKGIVLRVLDRLAGIKRIIKKYNNPTCKKQCTSNEWILKNRAMLKLTQDELEKLSRPAT